MAIGQILYLDSSHGLLRFARNDGCFLFLL